MTQTIFSAGSAGSLVSVLQDIAGGLDSAPNTDYTISLTAAMYDAGQVQATLPNGSSVTLTGAYPFNLPSFAVTGSVAADLNFTGTVTLDGGVFANAAIAVSTGLIVAGLFNGEVLGTSGDGGDTVINSATMQNTGAYPVVSLSSGVILNGWNGPDTALIAGEGGVTLTAGLVRNGGTIIAGGASNAGVALSGGTIDNGQLSDTGASISGGGYGVSVAGAGLVVNAGTIQGGSAGGVYLGSGTVTNGQPGNAAALIAGGTSGSGVLIGGSGVVTNFGSVLGYGLNGVALTGGGGVTNGAATDPTALIAGAYTGVNLGAAGSVANFGTILADGTGTAFSVIGVFLAAGGSVANTGTASVIQGGNWGVLAQGAGATLDNQGTVLATGGSGLGADLSLGGTVVNGPAAYIYGSFDGVRISSGGSLAGALVVNDGTIAGGVGVDFQSGPTEAAGTLVNAGLISGISGASQYAVIFGSGAERLVVRPGGAFVGAVLGNDMAGASTTLELGAGTDGGLVPSGDDAGTATDASGGFSFSHIGTIAFDAGAVWTIAGSGTFAALGNDGSLSVTGTGTALLVSGDVDAGGGTVDIEGGATLAPGGNLDLGADGPASLIVGPDGNLVLDSGGIVGMGGNATLFLSNTIEASFLSGVAAHIVTPASQAVAGFVDNVTFTIGNGADYVLNTPTVEGASAFNLTGAASELVLNAGGIGSGATVSFAGSNDIVVFGTGAALVPSIPDFAGVVDGFQVGDTLVVDTWGPATFQQNGSAIAVMQSGTATGTLSFDTRANAALALGTPGALVDHVLCFLAGTLILTPDGERAVERLRVGDLVRTASGVDRPVAWIGVGQVLATRGRRSAATPVIVRKGALAPNVPHTDLHVTKGHALWLDDVLIPVEFLVNHRSILWDDHAQEVSVYHVELDTHDVLVANGAAAESYRDDGNRYLFRNANAGWDQPAKVPCVPVLTGGPVVDAVWGRLLARSGPRPRVPLTGDDDLHLLVDGERVDGARRGDAMVFGLSRPPAEARIVSRSGVPVELGLSRDTRELGVALRHVRVRGSNCATLVEADDKMFAEGFHDFEAGLGIRWTTGDAVLPALLFDGLSGHVEVVLTLGGATQYPLSAASRAA